MKLLSRGNTKTVKGEKKGYITFILHLAPADLSGYNTCPQASAGCKAACLNTAGRGKFDRTQAARIRKTKMFYEQRDEFMALLVKDICAAERLAAREGMTAVFRLNGTSDIQWEYQAAALDFENVFTMFPNTQFYDYTAIARRVAFNTVKNYHLTFSQKEDNRTTATMLATLGHNVAVVFDEIPNEYNGRTVVPGDEDDLRFLDPEDVYVGLKAKGKAKKDTSGFVVITKRTK